MKITYRQTRIGKWIVCEAKPHKYGVGVKKVGTYTGAYTTGYQFKLLDTEQQAIEFMVNLAAERGFTIVPWVEPTPVNDQFIDLPDDKAMIAINADKTIELYRGAVLKNIDVTKGNWFGYDFAIVHMGNGTRLLESTDGRYRVGDLKQAILQFRRLVDATKTA